jgi:enoyl-CoA hydratase
MNGRVLFEAADAAGIARVTLSHPAKHNALSIAMWRELRAAFDGLRRDGGATRVVLLRGEGGQFASGGDIDEFTSFRFDPQTLRRFHDDDVSPALHAMLDCEIPLIAQIEGACVGGGLEIAACCDLRICAPDARFGIPIARLGFPLAPAEARIIARVFGETLLRELLLEARLLGAAEAHARGIVSRIAEDAAAEALASAERIAALSPQALRLNKRLLRQPAAAAPGSSGTPQWHEHFAYADSAEHREGVAAYLQKRPARF